MHHFVVERVVCLWFAAGVDLSWTSSHDPPDADNVWMGQSDDFLQSVGSHGEVDYGFEQFDGRVFLVEEGVVVAAEHHKFILMSGLSCNAHALSDGTAFEFQSIQLIVAIGISGGGQA